MEHILSEPSRLSAFNNSATVRYPKKGISITALDDFAEVKEFEIIDIAQHAKILTKNRADVLREKLKRRNMAAHPSSIEVTQAQVDDFVTDLVNNVIAKL